MASYIAHNLVEVELASGGIDASQTTIPLASGEGVKCRSTSGNTYYYPGVVYDSRYNAPHLDPAWEIVRVTSHDASSDTIAAVTRAAENSVDGTHGAVAHNASGVTYKLQFGFTRAMFEALGVQVQEDASSIVSVATVLNFENGPDITNPSGTTADVDFNTHGGFWNRKFHVPSTFNASKLTRKLYYTQLGRFYHGTGTRQSFSSTIYFSYFNFFVPEETGTTDELFMVRWGATVTESARFAIYDTVSSTDLSPGLRLYQSSQVALSALGSTSDGRWNCDPSASVTWRKGKVYWIATTTSNTQTVDGIPTLQIPFLQILGTDWADVSTPTTYAVGNVGLGLGTNYYEIGFPADMTAVQFSNVTTATGPLIWMHWAT